MLTKQIIVKFKRTTILAGMLLISLHFFAQNPDSGRTIRVLTYNILHGATVKGDFDLDRIAAVIRSVNPDIVALQEVDFKTNRVKKMDLVTELGQRTGMAPLFGKAMAYDGGEYGEGILSKYTFIATQNHPLRAGKGKEPRAALEVSIVLKSGDTIRFTGTHLDHTKDETDRIRQANQLNTVLTRDEKPAILAGDLNALPDSKTMAILLEKWQRSFTEDTPTYPSDNPDKKIDYILYRPANRWKVIETRVIDERIASDHRPVLTVLQLTD